MNHAQQGPGGGQEGQKHTKKHQVEDHRSCNTGRDQLTTVSALW